MLGKPIQEISFEDLVAFLETGVREGYALDFKADFPSNLEKTLAAFANTYGGIILIGVDELDTGAAALPIRGMALRPGLRERVLQKGLEAVHPPLLPEVHVIEFRSDPTLPAADRAVVTVNVAESSDAPHAIDQRTAVYVRGDNVSTRNDRRATIGEIEWFLNKRRSSRELKERLLTHAENRAMRVRPVRRARRQLSRYWRDGEMTLAISPVFPRLPLMRRDLWLDAVQKSIVEVGAVVREIPLGRFQRIAGGVFFDAEYSYSEYQQQGIIFHEFDYWWDYVGPNAGKVVRQLYPRVTADLLSGALRNAANLYTVADYPGSIEVSFQATDLAGAFFQDPRRVEHDVPRLVEATVQASRTASTSQLQDDPEAIAKEIQRELYWAFGHDAPKWWIEEDFRS